jgi:Mrp family chromosome partitioning ATPase
MTVDRIRKALDLARLERAQGDVQLFAERPALREEPYIEERPDLEPRIVEPHIVEPPAVEPPMEASAEPRAERPAPLAAHPVGAPAAVVYTRTKVFAPLRGHLERHRILSPEDSDSAASAYRMLRTQVLQRLDARQWRSLAVFSPGAHDGKTTTAINLAVSLAGDRLHTVLLVDFDLKHPALASSLGLDPEFGVDDVLTGSASLEECLYHPEGFNRLVVLPARAELGNSSEILAGPRSRELVAELRSRYPERVIIYDLPPVLAADDALSFAPLVECGLVVAAEGRTRRNDLVRTIELLSKTPLVGTVLNRATDAPAGY